MGDIFISEKPHRFSAYIAGEERPRHGAVIVIHEVWGLNKNIRGIADRLAREGYLALAPDLISHTGVTEEIDQSISAEIANPATRDEAQKKMRAAMTPLRAPEFGKEVILRLTACYNVLQKEYQATEIAVMGFCLGGTYSYAFAASGAKLAAALPFYGHAPQEEVELRKIKCHVYAFYGEKDTALAGGLPQLAETMRKLGKDFKYKVYPGAGHAFMNDTNPATYNKEAATDAWQEAIQFLGEHM